MAKWLDLENGEEYLKSRIKIGILLSNSFKIFEN